MSSDRIKDLLQTPTEQVLAWPPETMALNLWDIARSNAEALEDVKASMKDVDEKVNKLTDAKEAGALEPPRGIRGATVVGVMTNITIIVLALVFLFKG